jgi:hypothetical protein
MRTLVIGDIHGCFYELQALLDKVGLGEEDTILSVGDLVDRGPETPQTLAFFRETPNARAIMGNHERKHMRVARGEVYPSISQTISRFQLGEGEYPRALQWMSDLPLYIDLPEAIVMHGYLEPDLPLTEQESSVLCGTMGGERYLRSRYDRPWYELYTASKPVLFGHVNYTNSSQPFVYKDLFFGLDTSCVNGKALTGLLLPEFKILSIPSRSDLWSQVQQAYRQITPAPPPPNWNERSNQIMTELIEAVQTAHQTRLAQLQTSLPDYTRLSPRQQAKAYQREVGSGFLAELLGLARKGQLTRENINKLVRSPTLAQELIGQLRNEPHQEGFL